MQANSCKILLTGFGAFPGVPFNASAAIVPDIARAVRQTPGPGTLDVQTLELETTWRGAPDLLFRTLNEQRPDLVLHFGVSATAQGFAIETRARNDACPAPDAVGQCAALSCLQVGGPDQLPASYDSKAIVAQLRRANIPARLSHDAGTYLCNAVLYHSLLFARDHRPDMLAGFIHLPDTLRAVHSGDQSTKIDQAGCRPAAQSQLSWPDAVIGGGEIIKSCLAQLKETLPETSRRPATS